MTLYDQACVERPLWNLTLPLALAEIRVIDLWQHLEPAYRTASSKYYKDSAYGRMVRFLQNCDGRTNRNPRPTRTLGDLLADEKVLDFPNFGKKARECLQTALCTLGARFMQSPALDANDDAITEQQFLAQCRAVAGVIDAIILNAGRSSETVLLTIAAALKPAPSPKPERIIRESTQSASPSPPP